MKKMLLLFFGVVLFSASLIHANTFLEERQYEPVVMRGGVLSEFYNIPINEIYMYAYNESTEMLELIPFQIDERIRTAFEIDLDGTRKTFERHYYASKQVKKTSDDEWVDIVDDGVLDVDDELVFLAGDLGGIAPEAAWENINVEGGRRRAISVYDPNDMGKFAVGYLVHSKEKKDIPSYYNFSYNRENDTVQNTNYSIRMARPSGLISDISILSPLGSGVDIFDTQKIRIVGLIDLGIAAFTPGLNGLPAFNDRDNFYIFPQETYLSVTENPRVRVVREVHQTLRAFDLLFSELGVSFFVGTKFYPYSGTLEGGASLSPEILKDMFGDTDDIFIQFNLIRQSWDFNQNATGMKFYNLFNNGVAVDGVPDNSVSRSLSSTGPIREWTMMTGNQGTMFAHLVINDTTFQRAQLYYHDNKNGGQDDDSFVEGGDTGDGMSYGDNGIKIEESQSLDLGFTAYFVEKNKDKAFAEQLSYNVQNPVAFNSFIVDVADAKDDIRPQGFQLRQNYPNPFNNSTAISFFVPVQSDVKLEIYDMNGRLVKQLVNEKMPAGQHKVQWNGTDINNETVSTGIYVYKMTTENYQASKKLLLVK